MDNTRSELERRLARVTSASGATIRHWVGTSEDFREMFEDYTECQEMVRSWRSTVARRAARLDELEERSRQLEAQLVRFLQEHSEPKAPPRTPD